uniref:Glycosyl transferase CAP10 domain-containing protein n=1 Tax=Romanomermis culicivorax TaxID=13658 RepID=A0A915ISV1_ROMCU
MKLALPIISAIFIVHGQNSCFKGSDDCKFDKYTALIKKAEEEYNECTRPNTCDCLNQRFKDDLAVFSKGVNQNDFEKARSFGVHYQIIDRKLYRQENCMFAFRCSGVEHFILSVINQIPDCEFILNDRDYPQVLKSHQPLPIFSFSKTKEYADIMYPAWSFWEGGPAISLYPTGIGRWDLTRNVIKKYENFELKKIFFKIMLLFIFFIISRYLDFCFKLFFRRADLMPFKKKISKAFFRGSRTNSERDPLILLSRRNSDLVDAQYTRNQAWKSDADTLGQPAAEEISFEDHCSYKYLFNFRGVAASFRFRHLFLCRSLVFHVGEEWVEFFYMFLKPWIHYVPVSQLNDVEVLINYFLKNEAVAEKIAQRGFEWIYKYLTIENIECYWRRMLRQYATLLKFEVKRNRTLIQITK